MAVSSSEAEYIALSGATAEALWLSGLLEDMKITRPGTSVVIREDNRGCIGMATNLETKRSKHIDVRHHFIRDNVASGRIKIEPIETENQVADIFTKALDFNRFGMLRRTLGLSD